MAKGLKDFGISFGRDNLPSDTDVTIMKVSFTTNDKYGAQANIDGEVAGEFKQMFTTSKIVIKQLQEIMQTLHINEGEAWKEPITVFTAAVVSEKGRTYITLQ